jgi:hypothetical protein
MADQQPGVLQDVDAMTDEQRAALEAEEIARRTGRTHNPEIEPGLGEMGGAGAQGGIQPDVSTITPGVPKP